MRSRSSFDGMKCNVAHALQAIGDEWSVLIIRDAVFRGKSRYDEFLESLSILPTVLSKRLATLVDSGIFERSMYNEKPPRFEYKLTSAGKELEVLIKVLDNWGYEHAPRPEAADPITVSGYARSVISRWFSEPVAAAPGASSR